jgi:hypothetical protein
VDLIEEFRKALDGESEIDPFDFGVLVAQNANEETLARIFEKLPHGEAVKNRVKEVLHDNRVGGAYVLPDPANALSSENIVKLAKRYATSLKALLGIHRMSDVSDDVNPDTVQVISSNEEFLQLAAVPSFDQSEAYEALRLIVRSELKKITIGNFALNEALLGITNYAQICHYILTPAIELDLDTRAYYDVWRGGGDVAFPKGKLLILAPSHGTARRANFA